MKNKNFTLDTNSELRKRAARLAAEGETFCARRAWCDLAEEAASRRDWVLAEYAYKRGLGLRTLW
ncbi:MAG: hypothetical protein ACLFN0_07050 [Thermovirgaceae bacterium]